MQRNPWKLITFCALVISVGACAEEQEKKPLVPLERVLFVGNSFTGVNDGLENHLKKLAESATPPKRIHVESHTQGGATLSIHYKHTGAREVILDGAYDFVILQGDIPELIERNVKPFLEYARLFEKEISESGSKTVFFMTWPYERLDWIGLEEIADAHRQIGDELEALIAPVGVAFDRASEQRPELNMLGRDREHQTIDGTYLAANVMYSTLFGESPVGLTYKPWRVSAEEANFLQKVAWEVVQEWQQDQK